jgi:hypothetical protein
MFGLIGSSGGSAALRTGALMVRTIVVSPTSDDVKTWARRSGEYSKTRLVLRTAWLAVIHFCVQLPSASDSCLAQAASQLCRGDAATRYIRSQPAAATA